MPNRLLGSKCIGCGRIFFPKKFTCPSCKKMGLTEDTHLSGSGKIEAFTIVRTPLPGVKIPYTMAKIRLREGPSMIVRMPNDKSVKIGQTINSRYQ